MLPVSGQSHLGCGAGGHPACRQVRESNRQDAYLPHSQDGCAPSSRALFNKAKRLPASRFIYDKRGWKPRLLVGNDKAILGIELADQIPLGLTERGYVRSN